MRHLLRTGAVSLLILGLLALSGCASTPPQRPSELKTAEKVDAGRVEPQARTLFFQAERAFLGKDYDKALRLYAGVKRRFPRAGRAQMLSSYRIGTIHYYKEDYSEAASEFETFLRRFPDSNLNFDVRYNLAASEYQLGNFPRSYRTLSAFSLKDIQSQGPRRAEVVFQLTALSAEAMNNHSGAVAALAAHAQLPVSEAKRSELYSRARAHLVQMSDTAALDRLLSKTSEPTVRNLITQRMGFLAQAGSVAQAPAVEGGAVGASLRSGTRGDRQSVGVVLPLTGKFSRYGLRALEGITLAAKSFSSSRDGDFHIYIEDTESNPDVARRAVDTLVQKHDVMAIVGPMSWKESLAVADRAQQLGVPNISLTGKAGISARGAYLFQNALTPQVQLENLVDFAVRQRNLKRFAILAPNNTFGLDMSNQFWDLVEKSGGSVVAYQTYKPTEKDFQRYIREMIGLANLDFRKLEVQALDKFQEEYKEKTGRKPRVQLPPIVDFDAIFLPDSPRTVAQIAASLTYFDATNTVLLGTTEWNSDQLYKFGGRHVEGALFPGGLTEKSEDPKQREFLNEFSQAYGNAPDLLAGQAFEAMKLMTVAIDEASSSDRNDVVRELARMDDFNSPLGDVTFDTTRIARRKLPILKLEYGGNIVAQ